MNVLWKHLLTTNSETITFNSEFYDYFVILGGEINPVVNDNERVKNIDDYAIYINPDDIVKVEEQDDDSLFNTCIGNGRLYIRNIAHNYCYSLSVVCAAAGMYSMMSP